MPKLKPIMASAIVAILLLVSDITDAAVIVFDRITLVNQPVQLAVQTKGKLFPMGGQLVALYIGQTSLKRLLTGGDGHGYLMYTPSEAGLQTVSAVFEDKRESGRLLVMAKDEQVILIDVETALRESVFAAKPRKGSREALAALNKKFRIIYLYGLTGLTLTRQWLNANELTPSVVLPWRNAALIKTLNRIGVRQHALIGSASQMTAAKKHIQTRFSFEKTKDGRQINSWTDVFQALELKNPFDSE